MSANATVHVRMASDLKEKAEKIYKKFGMSPSDAIRIFYSQTCLEKAFPLRLKLPNDETLKAFSDSEEEQNLSTYENPEVLFKKLGI